MKKSIHSKSPASTRNAGKSPPSYSRKRRKKRKSMLPIYLGIGLIVLIIFIGAFFYFYGRSKFDGRFLPNTFINGMNVSGKTPSEISPMFDTGEIPDDLIITRPNGEQIKIKLSDFNYKSDKQEQLDKIYKQVNHNQWYKSLFEKQEYKFTETLSYDKAKLKALLKKSNWGEEKNKNAKIIETDKGYVVKDAVQGDIMDYNSLESYIIKQVDGKKFTVTATDSGSYTPPEVQAADLQEECDKINTVFGIKIVYDFDYTTEELSGKKLVDIISIDEKGKITVDEDKAMEYVEYLADKYDTYNTERKFKSTLQGEITVEPSADAQYGWMIDHEETWYELVELLENGESANIDPVYYSSGGFNYTGYESGRGEYNDIGDTYFEIDMTAQKLWFYKDGKKKFECDVVTGKTTDPKCITLEGVYKVLYKDTNFRMTGDNGGGDTWDDVCQHWVAVATCGVGLHDSSWRSAFGGEIYKYSGSHGCINMSRDSSAKVYDLAEVDMPCVMYY